MTNRILDLNQLRKLYPEPKGRSMEKVIGFLDSYFIKFIALSPFCVLSTIDADGHAEISPRGGEPGFIKAEDEKTLVMADRPGNNRLDSLTNLITNPSLAMLFLVPGFNETLRIYGNAEIIADENLSQKFELNDRIPKTVVKVNVLKGYFQCAKSLMRADLWNENAVIDRASFPTLGEILKDQTQSVEPAESQKEMVERYKKDL